MDYQESLEYLYKRLPMFQRVGTAAIKKDLTNTIKLLEALGNPHKRFQSIHIAGTNGKGTSAHTLAAILQCAGYKTGLYTSPHLKSFTERARINGVELPQDFVGVFVTKHQQVIESINPSFFEVTVAMAFAYFAQEAVDIAIVETGLGGRLDSTNVIEPIICLITMIGNDHADILGSTLSEIAGEKAGIIKPKTPVVIGADQPDVREVFHKKAASTQSPLIGLDGLSAVSTEHQIASQCFHLVKGDQVLLADIETDITAGYFLRNIPGIYLIVKELCSAGFEIDEAHFREGVRAVKELSGLKGRWQVLGEHPFVIADVSHNEAGIALLMDQVRDTRHGELHLVLGMVKDKDFQRIMDLMPKDALYYFTQSGVPRSLPARTFQEQALQMGLKGEAFDNVNRAIESAKKKAQSNDLILVCGSTFVVAEIENL